MERTSSLSEFLSYLESLAEKHNEIRHKRDGRTHFIRLDTDELDNSIKQIIGFPVVCIDRYSASLQGSSGNVSKKRGITIMILDYVADSKNYEKIHETWDRCETIADDFIAKIYSDIKAGVAAGIFDFELSDVEYELAGNKSLGLYGSIITFPVSSVFCVEPRYESFE